MLKFDARIAATGLSPGAAITTPYAGDFEYLALDIIDPWDFKA